MSNLLNRKISIIIIFFSSLLFNQNVIQINNIKVEGNIRLSEDDIKRISGIYPGLIIISDEIQRGVKKLWDLNRFNDIQIILEDEDINGINIIINFPNPRVYC